MKDPRDEAVKLYLEDNGVNPVVGTAKVVTMIEDMLRDAYLSGWEEALNHTRESE